MKQKIYSKDIILILAASFFYLSSPMLVTPLITGFSKGEPIPKENPPQSPIYDELEIVDKKVLPIAMIIMLFAIPYCATQSFLVNYVEAGNLSVSVSLFFPLYAVVLLVLRLTMRNLFDRLPFRVFLIGSSGSAFLAILALALMHNNMMLFFAALFMAGGYGIMCSVCQSTAILLAGPEKRGLANSTYYIGLDLGMALGPVLGGLLFGNLSLSLFYPVLLITVPLILLIYFIFCRRL